MRSRPEVDYLREKYALVALASYLTDFEGWDEVQLTVPVRSLGVGATRDGIVPPAIDADLDRTDPRYRYNFYTDIGGRIDLVAWRGPNAMLVEGKGTSAKPQAAIEQLIGRIVLWMDPTRTDLNYGILIPDLPLWSLLVASARHPVLKDITVYAINAAGDIRHQSWGRG